MAVTLTAEGLANALRGSVDAAGRPVANQPESRLLAVATTIVEKHAPGAPSEIQGEAVIRIAAWLLDREPGLQRETLGPRTHTYARTHISALRHSGAMALLRPWRRHTAGVAG